MDVEHNTLLQEIGRGDAVAIANLRTSGIPRHVGMAAAAKVLAQDITKAALEHIEARRSDGGLRKRFDEAADGAPEDVAIELLRETIALIAGRIRARGEAWLDESLRMEGQAVALEERMTRLVTVASENYEEATS